MTEHSGQTCVDGCNLAGSCLVVGLTGGIAAGKSTVAAMFKRMGARVLDADRVSREIVAPGEPGLAEVVRRFGKRMLLADGSLNRAELAGVVFGSKSELRDLNRITHPRIGRMLESRIRSVRWRDQEPRVIIVEAAVLLSSEWTMRVDRIVGVVAKHSLRLARLMKRYGQDDSIALRRLHSQISPRVLNDRSDYLIRGDLSLEDTRAQARRVWADLVRDAASLGQKTTAVSQGTHA